MLLVSRRYLICNEMHSRAQAWVSQGPHMVDLCEMAPPWLSVWLLVIAAGSSPAVCLFFLKMNRSCLALPTAAV